MGRILRLDLSRMKATEEQLKESILRKFIGGLSLGVKILYDEIPPGCNAFDPENRLIIMTSPLVGTLTPSANQYVAISKSPLTDLIGFGRAKGFFAPELKFAGYDGIIVQGRAEKPVYAWIHDGETEIKDAAHLWGKDAYETEDLIHKEIGNRRVRVASIGQAGENLVRAACIMNDKGHAAARCGIGAVMGSKKLKAIAVRGSKKVPVANQAMLLEARKEWLKISSEHPDAKVMSEYGTAGNYDRTEARNAAGDLPTKNWTSSTFQHWRNISGEYMRSKYSMKKTTCFNCHIGHDYEIEIPTGPHAGSYVYPEYEDTAAFGCNIGVSDTEAIIRLTDIANRYGMDSIECSHTLSLAMECYEKGILTEKDTGGIKLTWGDVKAAMRILDKIVRRDGIGDILAEGVKRAADSIGAPDLAVHIKKMSPILHDLRSKWGWLISYTVASAGPTHEGIGAGGVYTLDPDIHFSDECFSPFSAYRKGEAAKKAHIKWLGLDCLGVCVHAALGVPLRLHLKLLSAVTGWDIGVNEFFKVIERNINVTRAFNIRHGLRPRDEWPSRRILEPPTNGPAKGITAVKTLRGMIDDYYSEMGWDTRTGKPWRKTLIDLDLEEIADDLWE